MSKFLELLFGNSSEISLLLEESSRLLNKRRDLKEELVEVEHFIYCHAFSQETTSNPNSDSSFQLELKLNSERSTQIEAALSAIAQRLGRIAAEIKAIQLSHSHSHSIAEAN